MRENRSRPIPRVRALICALGASVLLLTAQACDSSNGTASSSKGAAAVASTASTPTASATTTSPATAAGTVKSTDGAPVRVLAHGVPTPTSIALGDGAVFVGAAGSSEGSKRPGGVFSLRGGVARRLPRSPAVIYGLAFHQGALYVAAGPEILRWSAWNGRSFTASRVIARGPKGFDGFNGLAFGPDGRIYSGVTLNDRDDHLRSTAPYGQSVVSLKADGSDLRVLAKGLREPFQLTFVNGRPDPYVSVLGQDNLGTSEPPDYIVRARAGQDYGFPACNWSKPAACARYAKPLVLLPAHASPMGIGAIGDTLYVALFGGTGHGPEVASISAAGGAVKPFLTGFTAPPVALGIDAGTVYAGDLGGTIYSVSTEPGVNSSS
jgi:glucose/arabinose dehydrogenase